MSIATDRSSFPLARLYAYAQSLGEQVRNTAGRTVRVVRIAVRRTDRRLGAAMGLSTTPLTWLHAYIQPVRERAEKMANRTVRLLRIAIRRADRRLGAAMGFSTTPLTWLNKYAQSAGGQVEKAANHGIRLLRVATWRTDKRLHRDWPRIVAGLKRFDGRPEMQGLLLGVFAMGSAFLLATSNIGTREAIAERAAEDLRYSLAQVVPAKHHDNNLAGDVAELQDKLEGQVSFHRARMGEKVAAVAFEMIGQGYAGGIKVLLGIDAEGRLLGVRVLSHTETPGLGDKIEVQKSDWILGFDGLSLGNPPAAMWKVKKDGGQFDQFSGATITPRAVVIAIRRGLELFKRKRDQFLGIPEKSKKETG